MALLAFTRRRRRAAFLPASAFTCAVAATVVVAALGDRVLYFYTPSEAANPRLAPGQIPNLAGLVETGSLESMENAVTRFAITDHKST